MKRRGLGMVFQRGATWWIQYHWRGKRYRETSGSTLRPDAIKILKKRFAEMGKGQLRGPDLEKLPLLIWCRWSVTITPSISGGLFGG